MVVSAFRVFCPYNNSVFFSEGCLAIAVVRICPPQIHSAKLNQHNEIKETCLGRDQTSRMKPCEGD